MGKYADALQALSDRISHHVKQGELLAGMNFTDIPVAEVHGIDDLPAIRFGVPTISEQKVPGGRDGGYVHATISVPISVSDRLKAGLPSLIEQAEKVMDAIDLDTDGNVDTTLNGTIRKPLGVTITGSFLTSNSSSMELSVTLAPHPNQRTQRNE